MSQNLVGLTVNPCKMCMPMGAVTALYGIERCMSLLHGSQGCSTYIRRHMATHYNEPVDIASSSLTEHGTVFGGADNLIKGLENLIEQYNPKVIGVPTTCLAETIGEDIPRIIQDFYETHPGVDATIIPIATPGYGGTQYEGFFAALRAVVEQVKMNEEKNDKVNIITGMISPADTRCLKSLLDQTGLDYILLPDISETLDGIHATEYDRLPLGGTPLDDISKMAGARMTIEFSAFVPSALSPAKYLKERFGVPYVRMNMPVGLRDTDEFLHRLTLLGGSIPQRVERERGRLVDAMIDSHKYNANGRAAVFGEPDLVYAVVRLMCENGVVPVLAATGSVCKGFADLLTPEINKAADSAFVKRVVVEDDTDFDVIERMSLELGANILIGSSEGRRISEKLHIKLVRCGFPIHDRIGGQRIRMLGYAGALELL
ncbi:MAG: nitrogenase component 1, partial [Acetanaerobacterium sp.]